MTAIPPTPQQPEAATPTDKAPSDKATTDKKPVNKERRATLRAGLFVLGAILGTVAVIIILGNAHRIFERHTHYVVYFTDVDGLMLDSPVRLGGLAVGSVDDITFATSLQDTRVKVELKVSNEFTSRIRTDSLARVASRGLLGDKTVDITLGSDTGKPVADRGELVAGAGSDISSVLKSATEAVSNVVAISYDLRKAVATYTDPRVSDEVIGAMKSLRGILDEVATGQGAAHALLYDPKTGADVRALVTSATQLASRLDSAVTRVDQMLEEVRSGNGSAHALLYGQEGKLALVELGSAAAELTTLVRDVRASKDSAVHALLLGDSKGVVEDLSAAATSLKNVVARVDRGEGSLGALVNDPSAYEDLKTILGNVKRNRVLRELVRMSISNRAEYSDVGTPLTPPEPEVKR